MKYNKFGVAVLICILLMLSTVSNAESTFSGKVVARETQVIKSPYGGNLENLYVQSGDLITKNANIAFLSSEKVYATLNGTVSGVFAHEGDFSETVINRYGAVLYIEPSNQYILNCSTEKSYSFSENKYVHIGEIVYLTCTTDGSHCGKGFVAALDESDPKKFIIEITEGAFYMNEKVGVFRAADYKSTSKIGQGTVERVTPIPINADGSISKIHVKSGDSIQRGQILFETVGGKLDYLMPIDSMVRSEVSGIIESVNNQKGVWIDKGEPIVTLYPLESIKLEISISELDLTEIAVGDEVSIEFIWHPNGGKRAMGKISSISYVCHNKEEQSGSAYYHAYVDFIPDENVRIGMSALIYTQ